MAHDKTINLGTHVDRSTRYNITLKTMAKIMKLNRDMMFLVCFFLGTIIYNYLVGS